MLTRPYHLALFAFVALSSILGLTSCTANESSVSTDAGTSVEFSDLRVEEVGATRAVVRFRTSIATTCEVEYGLASQTLDHSATDPSMSLTDPYALLHNVPLEDLTPATTYYYRARATTPQGNVFLSDVQTFETAQAGSLNLVNVALTSQGASVVERSSNYGGVGNNDVWGVVAAFDGQMATEWSTAGDGNGAYVVVDLGAVRHLQGVAFRSRAMSDGTSIIQSFQLSIGGVVYGPYQSPDPSQRYSFDLVPPVDAQSVRFEAVTSTGGNTGAREIELLAAAP